MGKVSGVVLVLAGLSAAVYALPSGSRVGEPDFGQFTEIGRTGTATKANDEPVMFVPAPKPAVRPARVVAAAEPMASFSAPVVVTIAPRAGEQSAAPKAVTMPRDRDSIGRELQKELKRVGCYEGELNGVWTAPTRQAMKAFTDRTNASLPTDEPDSILLTMVRGYQDRVCGKPCPSGQGLSGAGRCVPNAILVRAPANKPTAAPVIAAPQNKAVPAITGWTTSTAAAAPTPPTGSPPVEGRMALAGPSTDPQPSAEQPQQTPTPPVAEKKTRPVVAPAKGAWARSVFRVQESFH